MTDSNNQGPGRIEIRRADETHLAAVAELAGVIWRAHYPGIITSGQIDYMLAKMYSPDTLRQDLRDGIRYDRLFVDDQFVAFAAYGPAVPAGVFKLHKLYLHPDRHGQGLGSRLLQHCEAEVRRAGGQRLVLTVNKRNAGSIAVYQRNGFHIVESVVIDIGGGFVMDDYVMAKDLAP